MTLFLLTAVARADLVDPVGEVTRSWPVALGALVVAGALVALVVLVRLGRRA